MWAYLTGSDHRLGYFLQIYQNISIILVILPSNPKTKFLSMEISSLFPSKAAETDAVDMTRLSPFSLYNSDTLRPREVWCIVACGKDRSIGKEGALPWRLREDLRHFKEVTMGHPVIMGRKTWESLPKKPLPGRRNIVVTRDLSYEAANAETAGSIEAAVSMCGPADVPVIVGGAQIYSQALQYCTKLIVTEVEISVPDADAFFPELPDSEWGRAEEGEEQVSADGIHYRFVTYIRR